MENKNEMLFSDLTDQRQIASLFEWIIMYETSPNDVLREFAGMFITLKREIESSPLDGIDFCDRALDALYRGSVECDKDSERWQGRIARFLSGNDQPVEVRHAA